MKAFSLVAIVAFSFACNKEKAAVNKLDGTWTDYKETTTGGLDLTTCSGYTPYDGTITVTATFSAYEVGEAEKGTVIQTTTITPKGGTADVSKDTSDYAVSDDGKTLTFSKGTWSQAYEIVKLTKSSMEIKYTKNEDARTDCDDATKTEKKDITYTVTASK